MRFRLYWMLTLMAFTRCDSNTNTEETLSPYAELLQDRAEELKWVVDSAISGTEDEILLLELLDSIILDLDDLKIDNSRELLINLLEGIDTLDRSFYRDEGIRNAVLARENLKKGIGTRLEQLNYVKYSLGYIDWMFTKYDHRCLPNFRIRLFFGDTVHLEPNRTYKFPMAVYDDHNFAMDRPNWMESNPKYEHQYMEISTKNRSSGVVFYELGEVTGTNMMTGEPYSVNDTIWIKVN